MVYWYEVLFICTSVDGMLLIIKKRLCNDTNIGLYLLRRYWERRDAN